MSVWPKSLTGRLALVMAAALLVAQSASFVLLARAEDRAATARAVTGAVLLIETAVAEPDGFVARRRARFAERRVRRTAAPEAQGPRRRLAERAVLDELASRSVTAKDVRIAPTDTAGPRGLRDGLVVSVRVSEGDWLNATAPLPRRRPARFVPLAIQTIVIYLVLLVPVLWIGRHVAKPLGELTARTTRYRVGDPPGDALAAGPSDIKALAESIGAMQARIQGDLRERDSMLGAIGHDLRTPLTSLRLRTEQVADPALRAKMIATIERTEALLADTLALARSGQPDGAPVRADVAALAGSVARASRAAGGRVTLGATEPVHAPVYEEALSRALQNLIDNADRYAGGGTVTVQRDGDEAVVAVTDEGPGLPGGFEPGEAFARGEASRNRMSGGAGLGLAIARRIAEAHSGTLVVTPRPGGGTVAALRLPGAMTAP